MLEDDGTAITFTPGGKVYPACLTIQKMMSTYTYTFAHTLLSTEQLSRNTVRAKSIPGRIVVHDRVQVECQVLPRYFNHASFASLRRQLNYFAFSREGKGKQKGATYINDQVYDLNDILCLKRRLPGAISPTRSESTLGILETVSSEDKDAAETINEVPYVDEQSKLRKTKKNSSDTKRPSKKVRKIIDSVVPVVHLPTKTTKHSLNTGSSSRTNAFLPAQPTTVSLSPSTNTATTLLDLTKPEIEESSTCSSSILSNDHGLYQSSVSVATNFWSNIASIQNTLDTKKEEDIIAGCSALLSLGWQR
jgi:hypothetical protein